MNGERMQAEREIMEAKTLRGRGQWKIMVGREARPKMRQPPIACQDLRFLPKSLGALWP